MDVDSNIKSLFKKRRKKSPRSAGGIVSAFMINASLASTGLARSPAKLSRIPGILRANCLESPVLIVLIWLVIQNALQYATSVSFAVWILPAKEIFFKPYRVQILEKMMNGSTEGKSSLIFSPAALEKPVKHRFPPS